MIRDTFSCAAVLGLLFCGTLFADSDGRDFHDLARETLLTVWQRVNDSYYDPEFGGVDWEAQRDIFLAKLPEIESSGQLRVLLNDLLSQLGQSHFAIIASGADWYDMGGSGEGLSGLEIAWCEEMEALMILRVRKGSPAEEAGIEAGWKLLGIEETEVEQVWENLSASRLPEPLRIYTLMTVFQRGADGDPGEETSIRLVNFSGDSVNVKLTPKVDQRSSSQAFGNLPPLPMEFHKEDFSEGDFNFRLIRFSPFIGDINLQVRQAVSTANENGIDALILDLRGNPGGLGAMASGLSGLMTSQQLSLGTMRLREGEINFIAFPQRNPFTGPVAILVDGHSASTSEIMAGGLQEAGRAIVVGRRTAGAALPSYFAELPNGDILQHAIADFRTPSGVSIEGLGVTPDVIIPTRQEMISGDERFVVDAAVRALMEKGEL